MFVLHSRVDLHVQHMYVLLNEQVLYMRINPAVQQHVHVQRQHFVLFKLCVIYLMLKSLMPTSDKLALPHMLHGNTNLQTVYTFALAAADTAV